MEDFVQISFDFWSALLAFGMFQGVLMLLILLSFKRNLALYSLIGLVLVLVLNLFNQLLLSTQLAVEFPHLVFLATPFLFLIGPLYQWHIRGAIDPGFRPRRLLLHLIPFILGIVLMSPYYLASTLDKGAVLEAYYQADLIPLSVGSYLFMALQIAQTFGYIYRTSQSISNPSTHRHSKRRKQGVVWLKRFGLAFSIYWAIDFVALTSYTVLGAIHPQVFYLTMLGAALFINVLVIFIIRHHKEFNLLILTPFQAKYRNSTLSTQETNLILDKIFNVMDEEKPYLDPELSLAKFASIFDKTPHQISGILNESLGKSFYEFINEYRFKEVKTRLQSNQYGHLTLLAIALDSGFNNKNTFNKVFKRHSGKTPSQFLKEG